MTDKQRKYFEDILSTLKTFNEEAYKKVLEAEKDDKALCIEVAKKLDSMIRYETEGSEIKAIYFSTLGQKRLEKKIAQYKEAGLELPEQYKVEIRAREIIAMIEEA